MAAAAGALIPLSGVASPALAPLYPALGVPLVAASGAALFRDDGAGLRRTFRGTNLDLLLMILLLAADRLLRLR